MTSGLAHVPLSIEPSYCASKAALHSMTQSMRVQFSNLDVEVVEIFYPAVDTPFQDGHAPDNAIQPEEAAAVAIQGLNRNKEEIHVKMASVLYMMSRLMPKRAVKLINGFIPDNVESTFGKGTGFDIMTIQPVRQKVKKRNSTQIRLFMDIILLVGVVWVLMPQATGVPLHEWGSLLIILPLLIHLVLNWPWILVVSKRFFMRQSRQIRFNYLWGWFMFVTMVVTFFSGIMTSEAMLPAMGIPIVVDPFWIEIHAFSANSVMIIVGVHLGMHWRWITIHVNRHILQRPKQLKRG